MNAKHLAVIVAAQTIAAIVAVFFAEFVLKRHMMKNHGGE